MSGGLMKNLEREELLLLVNKMPNLPLLTTLNWTMVVAVVASLLIAKEQAQTKSLIDMSNYLSFAIIFVVFLVVFLWYQLRRVENKVDALFRLYNLVTDSVEDDIVSEPIQEVSTQMTDITEQAKDKEDDSDEGKKKEE